MMSPVFVQSLSDAADPLPPWDPKLKRAFLCADLNSIENRKALKIERQSESLGYNQTMNNRWSSLWYLAGRKALSRSRHGWWTGFTEATIASILILAGVISLAVFITVNWLSPTPTDFYTWILDYFLKPLVAIAMGVIGVTMVFRAIWAVGVSAERRGALVSRANQLEFLNEIRQQRGDLPTVPSKSNSPIKGRKLPYRIVASRQSIWGLITAGILCLIFVTIVAVLLVTAYVKWHNGRTDWVAGLLAFPISVAAAWSFYRFLRQFLKTITIGPTIVELEQYPVMPGKPNKIFLSQSGRLRLRLLDVRLVCVEEATFNQGTNTLTERRQIYSSRLIRKRGVRLVAREPFQHQIEFALPAGAMHSFQSSSNRITWQIEVHGQTKGFPKVVRTFEIVVVPARDLDPERTGRAILQSV